MDKEGVAEGTAIISTEEARAMLAKEAQSRVQQCSQVIDAALEQYQCQLAAQAYLTLDGRVSARVQIVPR